MCVAASPAALVEPHQQVCAQLFQDLYTWGVQSDSSDMWYFALRLATSIIYLLPTLTYDHWLRECRVCLKIYAEYPGCRRGKPMARPRISFV
jgi:hypothetical protein